MSEQAGITKRFTKNFLLDETKFRKICDVIRKHSEKLEEETYLGFFVRREDDSYYDTKNIEEVLKDDNIPGKAIQRVSISLMKKRPDKDKPTFNSEDKPIVFVAFIQDVEEKVTVGVEEKERDWCFLLSDDLTIQVQRTFKKRIFPFFTSKIFEIFVFTALGGGLIMWSSYFLTRVYPDIPLDSIHSMTTEMQIKKILELHIEQNIKSPWIIFAIMFSWILVFALIEIRPISRIIKKLNRSVFYWGDMKTIHDNFMAKVRRFKWGIGIAFIISTLAALIINLFFGK